jgi:hypothetical protein
MMPCSQSEMIAAMSPMSLSSWCMSEFLKKREFSCLNLQWGGVRVDGGVKRSRVCGVKEGMGDINE